MFVVAFGPSLMQDLSLYIYHEIVLRKADLLGP